MNIFDKNPLFVIWEGMTVADIAGQFNPSEFTGVFLSNHNKAKAREEHMNWVVDTHSKIVFSNGPIDKARNASLAFNFSYVECAANPPEEV